jgi:single-stranded DNA-binding protein|tara:strand:+ start:11860 stop:12183 length:324 start_codon:yes stop_codon:yes gene_type:complete
MNVCCFSGYVVDDPKIKNLDGVSLAEFTVVVHSYRTTKSTGKKSRISTFLNCEAWHTGAETIAKFAKKGVKIQIHASARNPAKGARGIVFRVNEFDFINSSQEESYA